MQKNLWIVQLIKKLKLYFNTTTLVTLTTATYLRVAYILEEMVLTLYSFNQFNTLPNLRMAHWLGKCSHLFYFDFHTVHKIQKTT